MIPSTERCVCQVDLIEAQVSSQSSLGGKMDALTVQVATQAMVGAKVEADFWSNKRVICRVYLGKETGLLHIYVCKYDILHLYVRYTQNHPWLVANIDTVVYYPFICLFSLGKVKIAESGCLHWPSLLRMGFSTCHLVKWWTLGGFKGSVWSTNSLAADDCCWLIVWCFPWVCGRCFGGCPQWFTGSWKLEVGRTMDRVCCRMSIQNMNHFGISA